MPRCSAADLVKQPYRSAVTLLYGSGTSNIVQYRVAQNRWLRQANMVLMIDIEEESRFSLMKSPLIHTERKRNTAPKLLSLYQVR